ncbi:MULTISPECIES: FadR/GntR family transcriptional regulator [unclassified Luteococcus]|uniref:FadR/GntR family transcriptional regulator n=1 Tax=unclassified Luteococcus TaxID=2639923 RepID=UPI00313CF854
MRGKVDQALDGLRHMIATGDLQPGDRLPSESELCEQFDVSRSSLREAQKMLVMAGVLVTRTGSGTVVSDLKPEDYMSGLQISVPLLPLDTYLELVDLRCLLEAHAAAQAAARLTTDQIHELRRLADDLASKPWNPTGADTDDQFHLLIASATGNQSVTTLINIIRTRGRHYRVFDDDTAQLLKAQSDAAHTRILHAIEDHDPNRAHAEMCAHVRTTLDWLRGMHPAPQVE